jgi:outer membrane protein assembly factor BamB
VCASKGELSAWDAQSNETRWSAKLPGEVSAQILLLSDRVIVPLDSAFVVAIGLEANRCPGRPILWRTKLETEVAEPHHHEGHGHDEEEKPPKHKPGTKLVEVCTSAGASAAGKIYLMGQESLFCLDADTGEMDWVYGGLGIARTDVLISGGRVYVGYEHEESKNTFITAINSGLPASGNWTQAGGDAARTYRVR